jgi:asparagine synthetase B (glutamine-hydrolysing)
MKIVADDQLARALADRSESIFYAGLAGEIRRETNRKGHEQYVIGHKYRGLFDDNDGSYVTVTASDDSVTLVDRDSYGGIPLYYSTRRPIVSTDMRLIIDLDHPPLSPQAGAEYLSASYLTAGKTIYQDVRALLPNEMIVVDGNHVRTKEKRIFPDIDGKGAQEAASLLEQALDNSVRDLQRRYPGAVLLNLSGGTDSTLLLAKMRALSPRKDIITTTYFHDDWRDDLDDWKYAAHASAAFSSRHQLVKIDNETFYRAHRDLLAKTRCVFHTYAAAFYAQNGAVLEIPDGIPIINGSGPDESIIGTEKISIADLQSLRTLRRGEWIDYLIENIDYAKISEQTVANLMTGGADGFIASRKQIAAELMDCPDFVELQRRYHAVTVLQDHIRELTAVAHALNRPICFPYLTHDIFRIIFSTRFDVLNSGGIYKSVVKGILEKFMPKQFVYRKKIGFQSPSRPYFKSDVGLGRELPRLLSKGTAGLLNLETVKKGIRERLAAELDLHARYDFLEWTVYNLLLLEEARTING